MNIYNTLQETKEICSAVNLYVEEKICELKIR